MRRCRFFKKAIIICSFIIGPNVKMLWCMARNFPLFSQMASAVILCRLRFLEGKKQKHGICPTRDSTNNANSRVGMAHVLNS